MAVSEKKKYQNEKACEALEKPGCGELCQNCLMRKNEEHKTVPRCIDGAWFCQCPSCGKLWT